MAAAAASWWSQHIHCSWLPPHTLAAAAAAAAAAEAVDFAALRRSRVLSRPQLKVIPTEGDSADLVDPWPPGNATGQVPVLV